VGAWRYPAGSRKLLPQVPLPYFGIKMGPKKGTKRGPNKISAAAAATATATSTALVVKDEN
jgi:hypothetical protein